MAIECGSFEAIDAREPDECWQPVSEMDEIVIHLPCGNSSGKPMRTLELGS